MEERCTDKHFSMIIYLLHKFIIADMIRAKRAVHLYYVYGGNSVTISIGNSISDGNYEIYI